MSKCQRLTPLLVGALLGILVLTVGCSRGDGNSFTLPILQNILKAAAPCSQPVSYTIQPTNIQNHDVLFSSKALQALTNPSLKIDTMTLVLKLNEKPETYQDVSLAINGIQATSRDSSPPYGRYQNDDNLTVRVQMDHLSLNGGQGVPHFVLALIDRHGTLKATVFGRDIHIASAQLDVNGEIQNACPPPPPPPPPAPPITTINSETPATNVINTTSISFSFSANQVGVSYACTLDSGTPTTCTSPQVYSNLSNGPHTFTVSATNAAGLSDANPPKYSWTVDTTPPVVTITPQATLTNSTSISLSFSLNEAGTAQCSLDGGAPTTCISPVLYTGLTAGSHVVAITAVDEYGNVSTSPASFAWTIDLTPPVTSIVSATPSNSPNNSTQISIQFSANESSAYQCSLDSGTTQACTSPISYSNLAEGTHTFSVTATDLAGNVGNAANYTWVVDLTPPMLTLGQVLPPQGPNNSNNISVDFSANETSTFTCSFDQAQATPCTSPFTTAVTTSGNHSLVITATDSAGNVGTPVALNWDMDFTIPSISFGTILPSSSSYINSSQMSFTVNSTESVTLEATLDGVAISNPTSPITVAGLTEGPHTLAITGVDIGGNVSNTITDNFTVELTPPAVTASATYNSVETNQTTNTFTFSANETATFQCQIDSAGYAPCQSPDLVAGFAQGTHTFNVEATDQAGNVSTPVAISWTVQTTPPSTTLTSQQTASNSMQFTFASSEANSTFVCSLDGAAASSCVSPMSVSSLSVGAHTFKVQAIDPAANIDPTGATAQFTILPLVNTTIVSISPKANPTNQTTFTFTFTSNHPAATFLCKLDNSLATACTSPKTYSQLANGTHAFTVQAVDEFGNVDPAGASYQFTINTIAPTVSLVPAVNSLTNQTTASFSFTANETVTFECELDAGGFSVCSSPMNLTGLTEGTHQFQVEAIDLAGNVSQPVSYSWAVDLTPPTTTVTSQQTGANSMSFTLSSSEANSTFLCSMDGAAATACSSPAVYSNIAAGTHTFEVQAVDSAGNVDPTGASVSFTTYPPIATTLVSESPSGTTINQSSVSFTFQANQPGATFLCSMDGAAATVCSSPMSYSGLANGNHTFVVQAVDQWGNVDPTGASYSFTVNLCSVGAPAISSVAATAVTQTSATITWQTDVASSSQVTFVLSATGASTTTTVDPTMVTSHSVQITGLQANTVYSVTAISASCGGSTTSGALLFRSLRAN